MSDQLIAGIASRIGREKAESVRATAHVAISAYELHGNAAKLNDAIVSHIRNSGAKMPIEHVRPVMIGATMAPSPAVRAIAEDLVRLTAPSDTPERRAIAEDARRHFSLHRVMRP